MSTVPLAAGGATAVICVDELTVQLVAATVPKFTAPTFVKFVPMTVTLVAPAVVPVVGETPVTVGAAAVNLLITKRVILVGLYCSSNSWLFRFYVQAPEKMTRKPATSSWIWAM